MSRRTQQVADEIKRIIGNAIQFELKDPRVGFATVVDVQISADLQLARISVSVMGDEVQRKESMQGLISARGYLRKRIGEELRLRTVPELRLELDTSLDYSMRISEVFREIEHERAVNPPRIDDTDSTEQEKGAREDE